MLELPHSEEQALSFCRKALAGLLCGADVPALTVPWRDDTKRVSPRSHLHLEPEMFIQLSGKTLFRCPRDNFALTAGGICVVPRRVNHFERALPHAGAPFVNIVVMCRPDRLHLHVADATIDGWPKGVAGFALEPPSLSQKLASYLDDLCEAAHGDLESQAFLTVELLRASLALLVVSIDAHEPLRKPENHKVRQCKTMVAGSLSDPGLSVAKLAEWINCAPDYLSHLFHKTTDVRLTEYINKQRIEHSIELLQTTTLNVSEVATACGFEDQGYFARQFKKSSGETPTAFRRLHQPTSPFP